MVSVAISSAKEICWPPLGPITEAMGPTHYLIVMRTIRVDCRNENNKFRGMLLNGGQIIHILDKNKKLWTEK